MGQENITRNRSVQNIKSPLGEISEREIVWCFGRTFWLSWSKERQKHNEDLVELRASSSHL